MASHSPEWPCCILVGFGGLRDTGITKRSPATSCRSYAYDDRSASERGHPFAQWLIHGDIVAWRESANHRRGEGVNLTTSTTTVNTHDSTDSRSVR